LSTVKKFTEAKIDSLTGKYTAEKYIPLEVDNSALTKIKDSGDVVILKYQSESVLLLSKTNYEKIADSKTFIIESAVNPGNGTIITRSLIRTDPNLTFSYIPALGERERILFFHVPMAWVSVVAFIMSLIFGIMYLRKTDIIYDHKASIAAGLGLLFSILATVTGAIWAKFNWGAFWNWDPRQTSIFVLILIYGAYFALRSAIESDETRAKLSSVYTILAGITVPFFIFILPRIVESLHPDPIINTEGKIKMDGLILAIFLSSLAGFTALYFWIFSLKVRIVKLKMKREE
jgi:heme exporter protein C